MQADKLICIPTKGFIHYKNAMFLFNVSRRINADLLCIEALGVDMIRNAMARQFLEGGYQELIFIDDDIVPPANYIEILESDHDIIAGITNVLMDKKNEKLSFAGYDTDLNFGKVLNKKQVVEVNRIGFGFVKIKRKVIEDIVNKFGSLCCFEYEHNGIDRIGEDYVFSKRAKSLGYKIHLHGGVYCSHYKTLDLKKVIINSIKNE